MAKYYREPVGECQRSGKKVPLSELIEDGYIPGLMVCKEWYEAEHPQERLGPITDDVKLHNPSPPLDEPLVQVKLPDADLRGQTATYYQYVDQAAMRAELTATVPLFAALYPSTTDISGVNAYTATGELVADGYEAGGQEVAYEIREQPGAAVVFIEDLLTPLIVADNVGAVLFYSGATNTAIAGVMLRQAREVTAKRFQLLMPVATQNLGVAVFGD